VTHSAENDARHALMYLRDNIGLTAFSCLCGLWVPEDGQEDLDVVQAFRSHVDRVTPPAETLHDLDDVAAEFGIDLRDIPPGLHLCVGCGLELDADDRNDRCEDCVTPPVECQHDPRYSREECAACGGQVSWCDKCGANLCGCPIPPGKTE
jgi:hypothetical protein